MAHPTTCPARGLPAAVSTSGSTDLSGNARRAGGEPFGNENRHGHSQIFASSVAELQTSGPSSYVPNVGSNEGGDRLRRRLVSSGSSDELSEADIGIVIRNDPHHLYRGSAPLLGLLVIELEPAALQNT